MGELYEIDRQQDRVEVKAAQGLQENGRCQDAVAGDAQETDQAGLSGLHQGLHRAAGLGDRVELLESSHAMDLIQIEVVDAQALQRLAKFSGSARSSALHGLAAEEETVALAR